MSTYEIEIKMERVINKDSGPYRYAPYINGKISFTKDGEESFNIKIPKSKQQLFWDLVSEQVVLALDDLGVIVNNSLKPDK